MTITDNKYRNDCRDAKIAFANACVGLTINNDMAMATSEIDGGHAIFQAKPHDYWRKKGLVEEKDLRIPNMRESCPRGQTS